MKYNIPLFFLWFWLSVSCMSDDLSDCLPEGDLNLFFTYEIDGEDLFDSAIESVDVTLFDENFTLITYQTIGREALQQNRGTQFKVTPGQYQVICWANIGANATILQETRSGDLKDWSVENLEYTTGDPLYYGPDEFAGLDEYENFSFITMLEDGEVDYTVNFIQAHRRIRIYVEGTTDIQDNENIAPKAQVNYVPKGYDFLLGIQGDLITYEGNTEWLKLNGRDVAYLPFYLPLYNNADFIEISLIRNSSENEIIRFSLGEYLQNNPPVDENDIEIYIRFMSTGVQIFMPDWNVLGNLTPEW